MADTALMPNNPKKPGSGSDRHKESYQCRIRSVFIDPLTELSKRQATSIPDEVNRAVRELLEREGLWPWPPEDEDDADGPPPKPRRKGKGE